MNNTITDLSVLRKHCGSMLDLPQWVAWKPSALPNGKTKKLLISPHTGGNASSTGETTWGTFAQVETFIAGNTSEYGVGFVFAGSDYWFIDVDNKCPHTDPWCIYLRSMLPEAFAETSQSGNGLHLIGRGKKPEGFTCKTDADWDIYSQGRFVAMTGRDVTGHVDTYDHTVAVTTLTETYLKPNVNKSIEWSDTAHPSYNCTKTNVELIQSALKSQSTANRFGGKASFKQLWECAAELNEFFPNDQDASKPDLSAIDMAMATHLMFWFGGDCQRVEEIMMNEWQGCRDKFVERGQYREDTILKARGLVTSFYCQTPSIITETLAAAPTPVTKHETTKPKWLDGIDYGVGDFSKEHTSNALQFLKYYYEHDIYGAGNIVSIEEDIYRFNGKHWEYMPDKILDTDVSLAMMHANPQSGVIDGTTKMLRRFVTKPVEQWGTYNGQDTTDLIVFQNGILNAATGEFGPHDKQYMTTNIMPYDYNPAATCTEWLDFTMRIFEHDPERVLLLQQWLGYLMVRDTSLQKAMLMIGMKRSGKGTIGKILEELVGSQNYAGCSLESFADDETINSWKNKTVVFDGDASANINRNVEGTVVERIKKFTAGDAIVFKRKFKTSQTLRFPTRITIAANNMFTFNDDSGAVASRFMILPFNKSWYGNEDLTLDKRLLAEIEGIAAWALQGLVSLRASGAFIIPKASLEEIDQLVASTSPLSTFAADCLDIGDAEAFESNAKLYGVYKTYATANGIKPWSSMAFSKKLSDTFRGKIFRAKQQNQRGFTGLSVKTTKVG